MPLKKISVDQLQLGMQLHELCGPWLEHPFWKKRFLLKDPEDLAKLRASTVKECWIDTDKGNDVSAAPPPVAAPVVVVAPPKPPARVSIEEEAHRAQALCRQTKAVVESLHGDIRLGKVIDTSQCLSLVDDISQSVARNSSALVSLARLKTHDTYSYMHSVAVCALMVTLGRQLGLDEQGCRDVGLGGMLHDLGKAMMPIEVLNKPGQLTPAEFELMKTHPQRGRDLLVQSGTGNDVAIDVCAHHHERPDGRGYPFGLSGDALSLEARMGAVCDVYDAITSNRPYKAGWDPGESISKMQAWADEGQFDKDVFKAFVESIGIYPIGSFVRLHSGKLAVVIDQNPNAATEPRVKIFYSTKSNMPIKPEIVDLARKGCPDYIVGREPNSKWQFKQLDELSTGHMLPKAKAREPSKLHERA